MEPQNQNPTQPNNQPQVQPQSAPQPVAPPSPQPVQQSQSASSMGLNQVPKQKKPWRRRIIKIVIGLVVLIILIVVASFIFISYHLPTTTYDNGAGQKFSMKFYRNPQTVPVTEMTLWNSEEMPLSGPDFLVATTMGEYPVVVQIKKQPEGRKSLYETDHICDEPPFTVTRNSEERDVCTFGAPLTEPQPGYLYEFNQDDDTYLVLVVQDIPQLVLTDPQKYKEAQENVDLRKHNDDIRIILESIKVEE